MRNINPPEDKIKISFFIAQSLLKDFDKINKEKGYQTRQKAILDLIENELKKSQS